MTGAEILTTKGDHSSSNAAKSTSRPANDRSAKAKFNDRSVYAADLDGDGDADVLSASVADDKIAWYENLGGSFGSQQVITTAADGAQSVYATDLDGAGDADVLSASQSDDKIAWYENQPPPPTITATVYGAGCGAPAMTFTPT